MADEDDGDAVGRQPAHDAEQFARFGGREDGGGFVEDQKSRLAGDGFDQLQLRFLADGEIGHAAMEAAKLDAGVADDVRGVASPHRQREVLGDGEFVHEEEVLVDDAGLRVVNRAGVW